VQEEISSSPIGLNGTINDRLNQLLLLFIKLEYWRTALRAIIWLVEIRAEIQQECVTFNRSGEMAFGSVINEVAINTG
jgi:hypothetical protein